MSYQILQNPSDELLSLLENKNSKERMLHAFLKSYPYVLVHLFNDSWNFYEMWSEFRLGTEFRADFVILNANSGYWTAHFIELEGPNDNLYTKKGTPSKKLAWAKRQTIDWSQFAREQDAALRREFARLTRPLQLPAQNNLIGKGASADIELEHPRTIVDYKYHVILGRSANFDDVARDAHRHYSLEDGVVTYDRVYAAMTEIESRYDSISDRRRVLSRKGKRDR